MGLVLGDANTIIHAGVIDQRIDSIKLLKSLPDSRATSLSAIPETGKPLETLSTLRFGTQSTGWRFESSQQLTLVLLTASLHSVAGTVAGGRLSIHSAVVKGTPVSEPKLGTVARAPELSGPETEGSR